MTISSREKRGAYLEAANAELKRISDLGAWIEGAAGSPILLVKGSPDADELAGGALLGGADGRALRAALLKLGYAPEDFCALASVARPGSGGEGPLPDEVFREAVEALDPEAVLLLDDAAAVSMREAYADALAAIEQFEVAMLEPGLVAPVLGRRVLALGGFEAALSDPAAKQRMWAYLKQLPPAGAPY